MTAEQSYTVDEFAKAERLSRSMSSGPYVRGRASITSAMFAASPTRPDSNGNGSSKLREVGDDHPNHSHRRTKVPFRTRALVMNEGARVVWRDEGAAYGNSPLSMSAIAGLEPYDCGALIVATNEQLRDASIDAELQIQNQLVKALASALDAAFIDPSNSGTAGIKPASVTNGVSSMNSPSEALFDWSDEFQGDANGSVILLNPYTAARLQSSNRPYVGSQDGSLGGWPVYTSTSVGPEDIVYLYPPAIMVALGNADLRVSTQASVEMVDTSSMTSATSVAAVNTTSLWQTNATGIIGSITANWVVTRPGAVAVFNTQSYGL